MSVVPGIKTNIKDTAMACGFKKLAAELRGKRDETERYSWCRESDDACTPVPGKYKGTSCSLGDQIDFLDEVRDGWVHDAKHCPKGEETDRRNGDRCPMAVWGAGLWLSLESSVRERIPSGRDNGSRLSHTLHKKLGFHPWAQDSALWAFVDRQFLTLGQSCAYRALFTSLDSSH